MIQGNNRAGWKAYIAFLALILTLLVGACEKPEANTSTNIGKIKPQGCSRPG